MTNPASYDYDIFLSHNHQDQDWTAGLAERLEQEDWQGRKLRVFFSPWDIIPGQSIPLEIERALPQSRKVGLIMSPEAIASAWVELERLVTTHIAVSAREARLIPLLRRACDIPALVQHLLYITLGQLGQLTAQEGDRTEGMRLLREAVSIFERLKSPNAEIARLMLAEVEKGEAS
jgi:hypothetical protein